MDDDASRFRRLRSLGEMVRRLGLPSALLWGTARAISMASADRWRLIRYRFVAQPVAAGPLAPEGRRSALVIRRVDAGDSLVAQFPRPPAVIAERFRMGAVCLAAEIDGRFAGFLWIKESHYPEDEVRCVYRIEPAADAVWDFDVYIEPAFRFGRTFARLWDAANAWLRERGYRWSSAESRLSIPIRLPRTDAWARASSAQRRSSGWAAPRSRFSIGHRLCMSAGAMSRPRHFGCGRRPPGSPIQCGCSSRMPAVDERFDLTPRIDRACRRAAAGSAGSHRGWYNCVVRDAGVRCRSLCARTARYGLERQDRVAFYLDKRFETVVAIFGDGGRRRRLRAGQPAAEGRAGRATSCATATCGCSSRRPSASTLLADDARDVPGPATTSS